MYINDAYYDDVEWYSWKIQYDKYHEELKNEPDIDIEESKIVEEFKEALNSILDEFYKSLFGDHCRITIYKDGTTDTEEYDHE